MKALLPLIFILAGLQLQLNAQSVEEGKQFYTVCAACHTIGGGKVVGPDLKGINEKRSEEWLIKFIQNSQAMVQAGDADAVAIFNEYMIPMPPNNLTDDQVRSLLAYIKAESEGTVTTEETPAETVEAEVEEEIIHQEEKAVDHYGRARNFSPAFWISAILILLMLFDLIFTRIIKAKFVHVTVIIISGIIIGEILYVEGTALGRQEGYSPDQPIAFSHKVHAQQNKIDCRYCHHTVDDSRHAGFPSAQLCMNCHNVVKEGKTTGKEEINKIYAAIENNQSIEWIKVHNIPDHVYFNHAQHVKVGEIACEECHGNVEAMDRVMQVSDLSMGWCIECHRETHVTQFESNEFYKQYTELHEKLKNGEIDMVSVADIGGNDCQRCHY